MSNLGKWMKKREEDFSNVQKLFQINQGQNDKDIQVTAKFLFYLNGVKLINLSC